jgi:LacI family transcriptional regulator
VVQGQSAGYRWSGSVTLHDVARAAGVHISTVSRALDPAKSARVKESTRTRIIEIANELGYRPDLVARGLKSGKTGTIGVVAADLGNTFVTPIIHGIAASLETVGMLPAIAETQDDHARMANIVDHMLSRRVDGIIALAARTADKELLESANHLVPVILAGRPLDRTSLHQVVHDNEAGGRLVAEHLRSLGHANVAQLRGPIDVANFPRRAKGFSSVAKEAGMIEITIPEQAERPVTEEGQRLMEALLDTSTELPTAVFAHNDLMALGALSVLRLRGMRVPDDMSIVGYNDLMTVAHLTPPLTTVRYQSLEAGRVAGKMMVDLLAGEHTDDVWLPPTLIARGSSRRV